MGYRAGARPAELAEGLAGVGGIEKVHRGVLAGVLIDGLVVEAYGCTFECRRASTAERLSDPHEGVQQDVIVGAAGTGGSPGTDRDRGDLDPDCGDAGALGAAPTIWVSAVRTDASSPGYLG